MNAQSIIDPPPPGHLTKSCITPPKRTFSPRGGKETFTLGISYQANETRLNVLLVRTQRLHWLAALHSRTTIHTLHTWRKRGKIVPGPRARESVRSKQLTCNGENQETQRPLHVCLLTLCRRCRMTRGRTAAARKVGRNTVTRAGCSLLGASHDLLRMRTTRSMRARKRGKSRGVWCGRESACVRLRAWSTEPLLPRRVKLSGDWKFTETYKFFIGRFCLFPLSTIDRIL